MQKRTLSSKAQLAMLALASLSAAIAGSGANCPFLPASGASSSRCGPEYLPAGEPVLSSSDVVVTPIDLAIVPDRIQILHDLESLQALIEPAPLGQVDFEIEEVIIFTTPEAPNNGCWGGNHCFNGVVDLTDGRRAVVVGFTSYGDQPVICTRLPDTVTRAVVVPRSELLPVLWFITETGTVEQYEEAISQ